MFLLGFLLISAVSAEIRQVYVDNYIVEIENKHRLKRVLPTNVPSDHLELSSLSFVDVADDCFKEANGLKRLSFNKVQFIFGLPPLVFRFLTNLEYLGLVNSRFVSSELRYAFWGLSNLRELNLTNTRLQVRKGSLFGLTNRTKIVLTGNDVSLEPSHFLEPYPLYRVCIINGIVQWFDRFQNTMNGSERCDMSFLKIDRSGPSLNNMGIQGFKKGWYRIFDVPVTGIYFDHNNISHLTSDFLNDLPKGLQKLDLSWNNITSVERGAFDNLNLRHLDLRGNQIERFDFFTFANTKLKFLGLTFNLATSMPQTLEKLTIGGHVGNYDFKFEDYSDDEYY